MMVHYNFDDSGLEGEATCEWFLQEVASCSEGPVARHHTWVSNSGIPSGDRSIHEHFVASKILEVAATLDQLNIVSLTCFELLVRRVQLIEQAHVHSPSNPDYTSSEDFMGWGPQRGGALVAPHLRRHVAERARDRAAWMKETRKANEEAQLRRPGKGSGKGKDKQPGKPKAKEDAPAGDG